MCTEGPEAHGIGSSESSYPDVEEGEKGKEYQCRYPEDTADDRDGEWCKGFRGWGRRRFVTVVVAKAETTSKEPDLAKGSAFDELKSVQQTIFNGSLFVRAVRDLPGDVRDGQPLDGVLERNLASTEECEGEGKRSAFRRRPSNGDGGAVQHGRRGYSDLQRLRGVEHGASGDTCNANGDTSIGTGSVRSAVLSLPGGEHHDAESDPNENLPRRPEPDGKGCRADVTKISRQELARGKTESDIQPRNATVDYGRRSNAEGKMRIGKLVARVEYDSQNITTLRIASVGDVPSGERYGKLASR
ncbi:hypothetical protein DFH09DRAFT_1497765 [Mycena vulgaris]|nr:hypothetical protein DFH09DRAFT_1497765 [Mycena vulgaris]